MSRSRQYQSECALVFASAVYMHATARSMTESAAVYTEVDVLGERGFYLVQNIRKYTNNHITRCKEL